MSRLAAIAIACILIALAACATPASRFYALSAAAPQATTSSAAAPQAATSSDLSVAVGPVSVPAAVDRPQFVVSTDANEVRLEEFNRWAAPLQSDIARVVAQNLVAQLGTPRVTLAAQTLSGEADYRAVIEVQRFESVPGAAATLDALWTVRRTRDGRALTGRTTVREPAPDGGYDGLAAAHSRAIARLSRDIADAVSTLDRSPK